MQKSKAIFLTGANGGMGSRLVPMLLERGWTVYAGVSGPATNLPAHPRLTTVPIDITDRASIDVAVQTVIAAQGDSDLQALVNLAGIIIQGPLEIIPETELRRAFEVNVFGPFAVTQRLLPLIRQGHGRVVTISAATALATGPFFGPVASSKVALAFLSDTLRMELAPWHIPVVDILPGAMHTPVFKKGQAAFEHSLATVPAAEQKLYASLIQGAAMALTKQRESDPKVAARTILRAVEAKHPKPRYFPGPDAKIARLLLQHFPIRMRDKILRSIMGMK